MRRLDAAFDEPARRLASSYAEPSLSALSQLRPQHASAGVLFSLSAELALVNGFLARLDDPTSRGLRELALANARLA